MAETVADSSCVTTYKGRVGVRLGNHWLWLLAGFIIFTMRLRPGSLPLPLLFPPPQILSGVKAAGERTLEGILCELLAEIAPPAL